MELDVSIKPMIDQIIFIKNKGYQIIKRPLDALITNDGTIIENHFRFEQELYQQQGQLFIDQHTISDPTFLSNDYQTDLKILNFYGKKSLSKSEYCAIKYVTKNWTKRWSKSPYGSSFYNSKHISWNFKPENSLRISDHWNFGQNNEHCRTTNPNFKSGWALGQYTNGHYKILKYF